MFLLACTGPADKAGSDGSDTDTTLGDTDVIDTDSGYPIVDGRVQCAEPPAAPVDGCEVAAGTGQTVVRGVVLTADRVYQQGEVRYDDDGVITCVGCDCAEPEDTVVSCPSGVVSPGLINPHDHLTFSENPPLAPSATRYDHRHEWRAVLSTPGNRNGSGATSAGNRVAEWRQVIAGTTALVGSGFAEGGLRNLDEGNGLEGLPMKPVLNQTFPLGDSNRQLKPNCTWSYRDDEDDFARSSAYIPHVAEGINTFAAEEVRCQHGRDAAGIDALEPNIAHIHAIGLDAVDYARMASSGTGLIWSPRSNISLYGHTAQVTLFDTLGGTLSLGTDWTYSGSATMLRELACAAYLNDVHYDGWFTDAELWAMATTTAAAHSGAAGLLGELVEGAFADIAVFDGRTLADHAAVVRAEDSRAVWLVLRGGEALFGDLDTVQGLRAGCETFPVCGEARGLCMSGDLGESWEDLVAAAPGAYPLTFCDTPANEPTCVPSRPGGYQGPTSDDSDGDGIPNATDGCPDIFDPIRPIDAGAQPDADGDGVPDACDDTPVPPDLDGDGVPNTIDVCFEDADESQADGDNDGRGDACDACPTYPNPLRGCPASLPVAATIPQIRGGQGGTVVFRGVLTGAGDSGFFLQDPTVNGGRNAGIYVFADYRLTFPLGTEVEVQGVPGDYFGEAQVEADLITRVGPATPIVPVSVSVADAVTSAYQGTLVALTDGMVTDLDYDCAADGNCGDAGLWEIDGADGVLVFDRLYRDGDWTAQKGTLPVVGVMGFRWERARIMPRTSADFGP